MTKVILGLPAVQAAPALVMDWKSPDGFPKVADLPKCQSGSKVNKFYVYVLFHPVDGTPCYVGKGHGRRARDQSRWPVNPHLRNIVKKTGLPLPFVIVREGLCERDSFELERVFIAAIGRREAGGPLANLTDGGEGISGARHTEEYKRIVSEANLGKKWGADFKEKLRAANTPEVREARAAKLRGKPKSAEHREKIRLANIGKKRSPEARAAMSRAWHASPARLK